MIITAVKIKGLILLTQGLLVKCAGISTGQVSCNRERGTEEELFQAVDSIWQIDVRFALEENLNIGVSIEAIRSL